MLKTKNKGKHYKVVKRKKNIAFRKTADFRLVFNMEAPEIKRQWKIPNAGDEMAE